MDEFAQSREDDDLFADEFEPVSEAVVVEDHSDPIPHKQSTTGGEKSVNDQSFNATTNGSRGERGGAQRGQRGRGGRGGRGRGDEYRSAGLSQSRYADPPAAQAPTPSQSQSHPQAQPTAESTSHPTSSEAQTDIPTTSIPQQLSNANSNATTTTEPRIHAVRGDRSATGGPAHKKLTEEELSAKMAAMAILNAKKAERHRLSEADSAAFEQREKEQQKKRVEEQKSRREMDMERARNRERKLKAQGGREWDEGKTESDIVDRTTGRSSQYVRGGHGGVIRGRGGSGLGGSRYAEVGDELPTGVRGGRGGGFNIRGRGGKARGNGTAQVPTSEDFPSLPNSKAVTSPTSEKPAGDWAEEMATPIEEKSG